MTSPYREPGLIETDEEKIRRWECELSMLYILNIHGRPLDERRQISDRIKELRRLIEHKLVMVR